MTADEQKHADECLTVPLRVYFEEIIRKEHEFFMAQFEADRRAVKVLAVVQWSVIGTAIAVAGIILSLTHGGR